MDKKPTLLPTNGKLYLDSSVQISVVTPSASSIISPYWANLSSTTKRSDAAITIQNTKRNDLTNQKLASQKKTNFVKKETWMAFFFFLFAIYFMAVFQVFTDETHYNFKRLDYLETDNEFRLVKNLRFEALVNEDQDSSSLEENAIIETELVEEFVVNPHLSEEELFYASSNDFETEDIVLAGNHGLEDRNYVLHDGGFLVLPHLANSHLADAFVNIFFVITILAVIFYCDCTQNALRRMFWIVGFLYILRAFTISLTVLPSPYPSCYSQQRYNSPFLTAFKVVLGMHVTCGDVLYSGHTMVINLCIYLWVFYSRIGLRSFLFRIGVWILGILGMLSIISTHFHYTDDVIIAFCFTWLAIIVYHWGMTFYEYKTLGVESKSEKFLVNNSQYIFYWLAEFVHLLEGDTLELNEKKIIV